MDSRNASPSLFRRRSDRKESGHVILTVAISMLVLLGFAGLATDVSYVEHVKRQMQTAADAGALAGAQVAATAGGDACSTAKANIQAAAIADVTLNGFTDGTNSVVVPPPNCPPANGTYAGNPNAVEVVVQQVNMPTFFLKALGRSWGTISVRAVAHVVGGNGCVIGLDSTPGDTAVSVGGAGDISVGCGVFANSNINCGSSNLIATFIGQAGSGGSCNPTPPLPQVVKGLVPMPDPLAGVPVPTATDCTPGGSGTAADPFTGSKNGMGSAGVYAPGVYCGGLTFHGGTATFKPGVYIIAGGGISENAGTALSGTGVTFYFTGTGGSPAITGESSYSGLSLNGHGTMTFDAPSSGPYQGVLFYGDRNLNKATPDSFKINGSSSDKINGVMYFPNTDITWQGSNTTSASTIAIVAHSVNVTGGGDLKGSLSGLPGGKLYSVAVLGE